MTFNKDTTVDQTTVPDTQDIAFTMIFLNNLPRALQTPVLDINEVFKPMDDSINSIATFDKSQEIYIQESIGSI